ncbi:hypothetical protein F2Q69_00052390 [Brassica cretica]|uniref:Uncharacterized protein n=1 Tax=Brassica cretica TaxID=69181 RepID=A0A8S9N0S0_BRACR|nr:hypothetical protein F2Q69_00052390 [Brassica cretica]
MLSSSGQGPTLEAVSRGSKFMWAIWDLYYVPPVVILSFAIPDFAAFGVMSHRGGKMKLAPVLVVSARQSSRFSGWSVVLLVFTFGGSHQDVAHSAFRLSSLLTLISEDEPNKCSFGVLIVLRQRALL